MNRATQRPGQGAPRLMSVGRMNGFDRRIVGPGDERSNGRLLSAVQITWLLGVSPEALQKLLRRHPDSLRPERLSPTTLWKESAILAWREEWESELEPSADSQRGFGGAA